MDNDLNLNGFKCKLLTFFRVIPHYSTYTLSCYVLDRITHADDLKVYMDPKLKFSDHFLVTSHPTPVDYFKLAYHHYLTVELCLVLGSLEILVPSYWVAFILMCQIDSLETTIF